MKKFLSVFIAITLLIAIFSGCSKNSTTPGDTGDGATQGSGKYKVGFTISERDQFLSSLEAAVVNAAKERDIEIVTFDAQQDIQKQQDHVASFAAQGFDAIIVNLVNEENTEALVNAANGIPLIFVNRTPADGYLEQGKVVYVGSDEAQAGQLQADFIAEYFVGKEPKTLDYVLFMGIMGLPNTNNRTKAVKEGMQAHGFTINPVFEDTAMYDRVTAMEKMQQLIGTGKKFDVVIANNDEMALGAIEAMRAANITDVPVLGIDATSNALTAVKNGELACTIFQNAKGQGEGALEVAYQIINDQPHETITWIPFEQVTIENVDDYINR